MVLEGLKKTQKFTCNEKQDTLIYKHRERIRFHRCLKLNSEDTNMNDTTTNNSRLTLVSALADGKPSIVAEVLIKQGRTVAEVQSFARTLNSAVQVATRWFKEESKRKEREDAELKRQQEEREKTERLIHEQAQIGIKHAKDVFMNTLIAGGMSKAMAKEMADSEFSHVFPMGKVTINYKGKVFETSVKGKASDDLKQVMKATGWNRKQIIEHFAVTQ